MAKPDDVQEDDEHWGAVIGRALCFLCLAAADLRDKPLAEQAELLEGLGLSRREAAAMLGTTTRSLTELYHQARKKKKRSKNNGARSRKKG